MPKSVAIRIVLGLAISILSGLNKAFGWFRALEYLREHASGVYGVLIDPTFEWTLIAVGIVIGATGLYELWKHKYSRDVLPEGGGSLKLSETHGSDSAATAVGSIQNVGSNPIFNIGPSASVAPQQKSPETPVIVCRGIVPKKCTFPLVVQKLQKTIEQSSVQCITVAFRNDAITYEGRANNVVAHLDYYIDGSFVAINEG